MKSRTGVETGTHSSLRFLMVLLLTANAVCFSGCVSVAAEAVVDTSLTAVKVPLKVGKTVIKAVIPGGGKKDKK